MIRAPRPRRHALVASAVGISACLAASLAPLAAGQASTSQDRPGSPRGIAVSVSVPVRGESFEVRSRLGGRLVRRVELQQRVDGRWRVAERDRTDRRGVARIAWSTHRPRVRVRIVAPAVRREGLVREAVRSRALTITTRAPVVAPPPAPSATAVPTGVPSGTATATPTASPTGTPSSRPQHASFTAARDAQGRVEVAVTTAEAMPGRAATLQVQDATGTWQALAALTLSGSLRSVFSDVVDLAELRGRPLRVHLAAHDGLADLVTAEQLPPRIVLEVDPTHGETHVVTAETNGGVEKVAFFVDGVLAGEDALRPWTFEVPHRTGVHDVVARAHDPLQSVLSEAASLVSPAVGVQADTGTAPGYRLETIQSGFDLPTSAAPAGEDLVFVSEKNGVVRAITSAAGEWSLPREVLDLRDLVFDEADAGLVGIAVDPGFATNGFVYVAYVVDEGVVDATWRSQQVVRYRWDGERLDPASRHVVLGSVTGPACHDPQHVRTPDCLPLYGSAHTVGDLAFDGDGNLLVGVGDGSLSPGALRTRVTAMRVQDPEVLVGKVLRVDPRTGHGVPGNPMFSGDGSANSSRVLATGFRNPFRFAVDGDRLVVGDVGESDFEEIDVVPLQPSGLLPNYGWPCLEAAVATDLGDVDDQDSPWHACVALRTSVTEPPAFTYPHTVGGGSITVGVPLEESAYPHPEDALFLYGDYAQNHLRTVSLPHAAAGTAGPPVADSTAAGGPVKIIRGPDGWVWSVSIYTGSLQRLTYSDEPVTDSCPIGQLRQSFHDLDGPDSMFDREYPDGPYRWLMPYIESYLPPDRLAPSTCVDDVRLDTTSGSPWATEQVPDTRAHPGDRFGVAWRGRVELPGGTYRFRVRGSEWMRLRVDDAPLHDFYSNDFWGDELRQHDVVLQPGVHVVDVEHVHGDREVAHAAVTWERIGGPPRVALTMADSHAGADGTVSWSVAVSDPDGDSAESLVAGTRVVAELLHYDGAEHHVHPFRVVTGEGSGTMAVDDVHAPDSAVIRLWAETTDASGASTRSAPAYACFDGGDVGPCAD